VAEAVRTKGPEKTKIILQHDNARPHTAKLTKAKLQELGWEVLPHPAYSPDLAPSDYHLFRDLQHELDEQHFENEDVKKWLQSILTRNPAFSLIEVSEDCLRNERKSYLNNGDYIE
jgi:[histone H3]-lysine36 N-dimethyltransferase SETMAR